MKYLIDNHMVNSKMRLVVNRFLLIFVAVSAFLYQSCHSDKEKDSESTAIVRTAEKEISIVVGTGKIEPEHEIIPLAAASGGIVKSVLKNDGERAEEGEVLVVLDSDEENTKVAQLRAQLNVQENQVTIDRLSVEETELRLADKRKLLESAGALLRDGAEAVRNVEDLKTEVLLLEKNLEMAKASQALSIAGLERSKAELQSALVALGKKTLRAPFSGVVLDMQCSPGSALPQFGEYALFAPDGRRVARCEVDELFASKVKPGQTADISFVGSNNVIATGTVVSTSPFLKRKSIFSETPGDREDRRVREVIIVLEDPADLLINSMVECKIKTAP